MLYNNIGILSEFEVIAFIDDNLNLNNVTISNKNVFSKNSGFMDTYKVQKK